MNTYIQRTKDLILDYLGKAQQTDAKIEEGHKIYNEEAMKREETRLRNELATARKDIEAKIDGVYREASATAKEWGKLDGSKLTADAQLLNGQGVSPEQFDELVTRYQDNYTMLDALRKYGEARNKDARESGHDPLVGPYNVWNIPGPDAKAKEWDNMRKRASYFLNVADGMGFGSKYEHIFATSTAQREFDAWGEDQPEPQTIRGEEAVNAFNDAWGFIPK